jgi:hypothetical protein
MSFVEGDFGNNPSTKELHHGATGRSLKNRAIEASRAGREQAQGRKILKKVVNEEGGIEGVSDADEGVFLKSSPFDRAALKQQSYSTDAQAVETKVARNPATQYLVINSKDRNQTSSTGVYSKQPWNQFRLQRPQALMQTYATRMLVSEINFPYYIPNVNPLTNRFWIIGLDNDNEIPTLYQVTLVTGFYAATSGDALFNLEFVIANILNQTPGYSQSGSIVNLAGGGGKLLAPPEVNYLPNGTFEWLDQGGSFSLFFYNPCPLLTGEGTIPLVIPPLQAAPTETQYNSSASLLNMMGMDYGQVIGLPITVGVVGNPTTLQYTQYIDIVSDKLHQYTTNRDGNSDNFFSRNLLCRLYISDEASNVVQGFQSQAAGNAFLINFIPGVNAPMIIHRQFKNPKAVMWNKEASVDWLDISVYDQYGNLVPVIPYNQNLASYNYPPTFFTYPDFQITLLASEN